MLTREHPPSASGHHNGAMLQHDAPTPAPWSACFPCFEVRAARVPNQRLVQVIDPTTPGTHSPGSAQSQILQTVARKTPVAGYPSPFLSPLRGTQDPTAIRHTPFGRCLGLLVLPAPVLDVTNGDQRGTGHRSPVVEGPAFLLECRAIVLLDDVLNVRKVVCNHRIGIIREHVKCLAHHACPFGIPTPASAISTPFMNMQSNSGITPAPSAYQTPASTNRILRRNPPGLRS